MHAGDKISIRILIHDEAKNKGLINELNRKRSLEITNFFLQEGIPASNLKVIKTPGREVKGFISDDMKNLLVYDIEVYKALSTAQYSRANELDLQYPAKQVFSFPSALQDISVNCAGGTVLKFTPGSFEYKNGLAVVSDIKLEIQEFPKLSDISGGGLITMSDNESLNAAGILWVKAICGNKEVRLKKGKMISINFQNTQELSDAALYTGELTDGLLILHAFDPINAAAHVDHQYTISSPVLHWIACAAPDKAPAKGSLSLKVSANFPVTARIIVGGESKVLDAVLVPESKELLFPHLPLGKQASLVVYGEKEGKIYFYSEQFTTSAEAKEKVSLKESNLDALKSALKAAAQ